MSKIRFDIESIQADLLIMHSLRNNLEHIKQNIKDCLDLLEYATSPEYINELSQKLELIQANIDKINNNTKDLENQLSRSIDKINETKLMGWTLAFLYNNTQKQFV